MRVLIYPHDLNMGGSQTNALELAAKMRDLDVEPIIFGQPGVLCSRMNQLGLEFVESSDPGRRPSLRMSAQLRSLARSRKIDILHGYEWPPALECAAAAGATQRTRSIATVMSMAVAPFIPDSMPLVVGTEQIAAVERASGRRRRVYVIEPPVDLAHNVSPSPRQLAAFRQRWRIRDDAMTVVCVSRLANELKAEGLLSAIDAVSDHLRDVDIQLVIVGDGPARQQIKAAADAANHRVAQDRVILTGEILDPRAAYQTADVVVGMGGSALRAMAFSKPLIVQGEGGFFRLLTHASWQQFAWQGWYGVGSDPTAGAASLAKILRGLISDEVERRQSSAFGRKLVEERFSLESAAKRQLEIYDAAFEAREAPARLFASAARSAAGLAQYVARRKLNRVLRRGAADDFNARPVAGSREAMAVGADSAIVYLSGAPWHAVSGTDLNLAKALGTVGPVVWVDPPVSIVARIRRRIDVPAISQVAKGVTRIHSTAPPGVTRVGIRSVARWLAYRNTQSYLRDANMTVRAVITSSPEPLLARWLGFRAPMIYFATDDFVAGAELLGLSRIHVERALQSNLESADVVLAVSPTLVTSLEQRGARAMLFPNGTDVDRYRGIEHVARADEIELPSPIAAVFGQLNERLDLDLLESVVGEGVSLLLLGPRYDHDPDFHQRLSRIISSPNVQWIERRASHELPPYMAAVKVGLTPYAVTPFNQASFPLKTLEYLSAGCVVVSSELPANDLLDARVVRSAATPQAFGELVRELLHTPRLASEADLCRQEAERFSWAVRAEELTGMISSLGGASTFNAAGYSRREATS